MSANGSRLVGIFVSSSLVTLVVVPVAVRSTSRRGGRHRDGFGDRCNLHQERQIDVLADLHDEILADERPEAVEGDREGVRTGREVEKPELAGRRGDERPRRVDALERRRHARQNAALLVLNDARDVAALDLRECREPQMKRSASATIVRVIRFRECLLTAI